MDTGQNRTESTALEVHYLWQPAFLAALRLAGCVSHACRAVKRKRSWVYEVRKACPDFAEAWDDALDEYVDDLKAAAVERATDGARELVTYQGAVVYVWLTPEGTPVPEGTPGSAPAPLVKRRYSDALLLRLLESGRPKEFASQSRTVVAGDADAPVKVTFDVFARIRELTGIDLGAPGERPGGGDGPGEPVPA